MRALNGVYKFCCLVGIIFCLYVFVLVRSGYAQPPSDHGYISQVTQNRQVQSVDGASQESRGLRIVLVISLAFVFVLGTALYWNYQQLSVLKKKSRKLRDEKKDLTE